MGSVDGLILSLDDGGFDPAIEKILESLDQEALKKLMGEMEAVAETISDPGQRHVFKNGISAIKMTIDFM